MSNQRGSLDRWAFEMGTSRDKSRDLAPSNDSAAGGKRAFEMPVGLNSTGSPNPLISPKNIATTRGSYATQAASATTERAVASGMATAGSVVAGSAAVVAVTAALGLGAAAPPFIPALLGVYIACVFITRQKGLNKELSANLFFIKMEAERMIRIQSVIQDIAKENGINLNTTSLSNIMKSLGDNIMKFSSEQTRKDIDTYEKYIKQNKDDTSILIELNKKIIESKTEVTNAIKSKTQSGGIFKWVKSWSRRWLSPDETLRQIIRDITIATVWYSIMLGEFDIFMRYVESKSAIKNNWIREKNFISLLIANRQLAMTGEYKDGEYSDFYKILDIETLNEAVGKIDKIAGNITQQLNEGDPTPPGGGRRKTYRRRYRKI